ncbi:MAG: TVP38/TMEM64 family protein [Gemmatimonadota bacterium]|nr:TVP38/TMEM64 family protein [Gemmatimonadota bacterium]
MASSKKGGWLKLAILALVILGAFLFAWHHGWLDAKRLAALAGRLRVQQGARGAGAIFVAIYGTAAAVGIPGTPLNLAGGAIFGFWVGLLCNWLGCIIGAAGGYWLARLLGKDAVRRLLRGHSQKLEKLRHSGGFLMMLRLQLIPVVPMSLTNFAAGLAKMDFANYIAAVAIGTLPGTAIYTYFADAVLSRAAGAEHNAMMNVVIACGLLIALSFAPSIGRITKGALTE